MISICVGTVRGNTVGYLVDSLLGQSYTDWELILAAQGTDPGLSSAMNRQTEKDPRIRVFRTEQFGRSRALNQAVSRSKGDVVAFTDDDCEAHEDWLGVVWDHFLRFPEVGIVAGDLRPKGQSRLLSVCPATWTTALIYKPSQHNYVGPPGYYWGGANFAVRREIFERIGGLDPYLGPGTAYEGAEDVDFGLRAELLDVAVATTPDAIIYHTHGRRNGIRQCMRHLRAYASGQGALSGKLEIMAHPWATRTREKSSFFEVLRAQSFKRIIMESYQKHYRADAKSTYLQNFRVGKNNLTVPIMSALEAENVAMSGV